MILVCFTREVSLLISVAKWDRFYQRWWFLFFTNRKLFFVTVVYFAFVFELFHCPENAETNLTVSATSSLQLFLRPTSGTYRVEYKWNHLVVCMCCWYVCKYISWIWNINQSKCMENFYVISLYKHDFGVSLYYPNFRIPQIVGNFIGKFASNSCNTSEASICASFMCCHTAANVLPSKNCI